MNPQPPAPEDGFEQTKRDVAEAQRIVDQAHINRPPIGAKVQMYPDANVLTVTRHTARGFTYKGALPISVPRRGIHGDGTGEMFLDVPGVAWALATEPTPPAAQSLAEELAKKVIPDAVIFADEAEHVVDLRNRATAILTPVLAKLVQERDELKAQFTPNGSLARENEALRADVERLETISRVHRESGISLAADLDSAHAEAADLREKLERAEAREKILVDAMSEVKATDEGNSTQPIRNIVAGCITELAAIDAAQALNQTKK